MAAWISAFLLLTSLVCPKVVQANSKIKVYFNNDPNFSYRDPYRKIQKPGNDFEAIIISKIKTAKKSVSVAVQEFNLPGLAQELIEAKRRGVDVKVILEDKYNRTFANISANDLFLMDEYTRHRVKEQLSFLDQNGTGKISNIEISQRDAITMLKNGKVEVRDDTYNGAPKAGLMHHKFVIIDGSRLIATTANFTRSGTHGDFNNTHSIGNANALMTIADDKVAQYFQEEFDYMWSGKFKTKKPFRAIKEFTVDGSKLKIQFSPTSASKPWDDSVNGNIAKEILNAKESIKANLFLFAEQKLADAVDKARTANHQLDFTFIIDKLFATQYYSELLDMWGLKKLNPSSCQYEAGNAPWTKAEPNAGGIPIMNAGDKLHHKFAVIDRKRVLFGSHNWSESANSGNDEFFMVIEDDEIVQAFHEEYKRTLNKTNLGPEKKVYDQISDAEYSCNNPKP